MSKSHLGKFSTQETKDKISKSHLGKTHSQETKDKMRKSSLGRKHTDESKQKISDRFYGVPKTDEHKMNMSLCQRGEKSHWYGKTHSQETKDKISTSSLGRKQIIVRCPYCNKTGGISNMKRYHFNNCKMKESN